MNTEVLSTKDPPSFEAAVAKAASLLRAGHLVVLPTETVYGLAANALNPDAVARIYEVKGRPSHNPIIVHVSSLEMARRCVSSWPETATQLAKAFWPGPLTLVLPKSNDVPPIVTAGGPTVGVRWPSHPFIEAVIGACDFPLAAPSANPSNEISPTSAQHVLRTLGGKVPLIVDGGPAQVGIESTVLDLTSFPPRILRPGIIHPESLFAALPKGSGHTMGSQVTSWEGTALRSPGLLKKHYSPKASLRVLYWENEQELESQLLNSSVAHKNIHVLAYSRIPAIGQFGRVSVMPHDARSYARALYAELHQCDELNAELIVVEAPPATDEWTGVADRLSRASAH